MFRAVEELKDVGFKVFAALVGGTDWFGTWGQLRLCNRTEVLEDEHLKKRRLVRGHHGDKMDLSNNFVNNRVN